MAGPPTSIGRLNLPDPNPLIRLSVRVFLFLPFRQRIRHAAKGSERSVPLIVEAPAMIISARSTPISIRVPGGDGPEHFDGHGRLRVLQFQALAAQMDGAGNA
jgi:hypothetical protein